MKGLSTTLIVISLLVVMAISNPTKPEYVNWVKGQVMQQNNNILVQGLVAFAGDKLIDSYTIINNYIFFSVFETNVGNGIKLKTIGMLHNFIPLSKANEGSSSKSSILSDDTNNTKPNSNVDKDIQKINGQAQRSAPISEANAEYRTYKNARYGFSIDYPQNFRVIDDSQNGDGVKIISDTDKSEILVYGSNNVFNDTPTSSYNRAIKSIKSEIAYKYISDNWYVLSWLENGDIKYLKSVVGSGSENTFIITYSEKIKDKYDSIVDRVSKSFSTPGISTAH